MVGNVGVAVVDRVERFLGGATATLEQHHRDGDNDGQARPDQDAHRVLDLTAALVAGAPVTPKAQVSLAAQDKLRRRLANRTEIPCVSG